MDEKKIMDRILESAEQVSPPDSLSPEQIEKMLKNSSSTASVNKDRAENTGYEKDLQKTGKHSDTDKNDNISFYKRRLLIYRIGAAAAVFAILILGYKTANISPALQNTSVKSADTIETELKTESFEASDKAASAKQSKTLDETAFAEQNDSLSKAASIEQNDSISEAASIEQNDSISEAASDEQNNSDEASTHTLTPVSSYKDIYDALYEAVSNPSLSARSGIMSTMEMNYSAAEDGTSSTFDSADPADPSFSVTNIQEIGVDEADIVKTDGAYIYVLNKNGSLSIISTDKNKLNETAVISLPDGHEAKELYVDGSLLCITAAAYESDLNNIKDTYYTDKKQRTYLYTYDISNPSDPKLTGTCRQDGNYLQSRKNGNYLYLFSVYTPSILTNMDDSTFIPETSQGKIPAENIYLPENLQDTRYLVISSVSLEAPDKIIDQKAVVSGSNMFYVSKDNIYIATDNWNTYFYYDNETVTTELIKFHYDEGNITGVGAGIVPGYLNDTFSMNEYDGCLRLVTTKNNQDGELNDLYILDENLQQTGSIKDLAPNETIRSARFLGNTGFFVTFRQTDPLFSVDLSDPYHPEVLGELHISGFSSYLHFYNDHLLLGLGFEADEQTGITSGLKLSMFDISDPSNVKEVQRLVLDGITWCDALNNYKSILMDPQKNLFGFACDNRYLLFSFDEDTGFQKEIIYDFFNQMTSLNTDTETRGLYINDTFYLVKPSTVTSLDMNQSYREIEQLSF